MNATTLRAPAKLNLSLEVLNRQNDGLHALRSVMVPIDLFDEIDIQPHAGALELSCDDPSLNDDNLVTRAWHELHITTGAKVTLRKNIPVGAGLGGGSSDAAAILLAAQRGALAGADRIDYLAAAKKLGSDVPFFLVETAALVEGTGERVTALGSVPNWYAVIIKPPDSIATSAAYSALDAGERPVRPRNTSASLRLAEALQRSQFDVVVKLMQNDFLHVYENVAGIKTALNLFNAQGVKPMLSGSGSAVFALAQNDAECTALYERIQAPPQYRLMRAAFWSGESWTR